MIRRVLVPNRGEIAVRIARACREAGIESVLGYSEADDIRYVRRYFDDAIPLGSGDARETYLDVARVIDAARDVRRRRDPSRLRISFRARGAGGGVR